MPRRGAGSSARSSASTCVRSRAIRSRPSGIRYRVSCARTDDALVADLDVELRAPARGRCSRMRDDAADSSARAAGLPRLQRFPRHCRCDARCARTDGAHSDREFSSRAISSRTRCPTTSRTARIVRRIRCCICCGRRASIARLPRMPDTASIYEANIATLRPTRRGGLAEALVALRAEDRKRDDAKQAAGGGVRLWCCDHGGARRRRSAKSTRSSSGSVPITRSSSTRTTIRRSTA